MFQKRNLNLFVFSPIHFFSNTTLGNHCFRAIPGILNIDENLDSTLKFAVKSREFIKILTYTSSSCLIK